MPMRASAPFRCRNTCNFSRAIASCNGRAHHPPPFVALGNWIEQTDLLIIPGGRDIPYDRLLKGKGTDNIRRFVRKRRKVFRHLCWSLLCSKEVIFEKEPT
ncbi:MAG: hypothetical protein H7A42_01955 [Chlamydiales bacterium]|nr:hypothetical protein [Chlamydiales bacterium]